MYKECEISNKKQAIAQAKLGHLFWRDSFGSVRLAGVAKVNASWGVFEFFTCTHREPRNFVTT